MVNPSIAYDDFKAYVALAAGRPVSGLTLNSGRGWSGPFSIVDYEFVKAHLVDDIEVQDAMDVGLEVEHSEVLRPFDFSWSSIRIGLHLSFPFLGSLVNPGLTLGLVNSDGGGVGQSTTGNFVGVATTDPTDVGQMVLDNQDLDNPQLVIRPMPRLTSGIAPAAVALAKVGTVYQAAALNSIPRYAAKPRIDSLHRRSVLIADITRGFPHYTVTLYTATPSLAARDANAEDFLTAMLSDKPRIQSENLIGSSVEVLTSEDSGVFNALNCFWPSTVPAVFHAVSARRLS